MKYLEKNKYLPTLWLVVYLLFIFFITLFSRSFSLIRDCRINLFWSYVEWYRRGPILNSQILLNIAMYVPLGYFLFNVLQSWRIKRVGLLTVVICFFLSAAIEILQYLSGVGTCDADDVIHNILGACLGVVFYKILIHFSSVERLKWWKYALPLLFLAAGAVGCYIASNFDRVLIYRNVAQFNFGIKHVVSNSKTISLRGYCHAYDRNTPDYQIWLRGEQTGKLYKGVTIINGNDFSASIPIDKEEKFEVVVKFWGFDPMNASTYVNSNRIEYVSGQVKIPDIQGTDLGLIAQKGVLKAYEPDYDVYVYKVKDKIYWLIGTSIDKRTEILFRLYTNEPDKLPKHRKKSIFDNYSFRPGAGNEITGSMRCGKYRVFERNIPEGYNITAVMVGFYTDKKIQWERCFRLTRE